MRTFINSLMAARTESELNRIEWDNAELLNQNPRAWRFIRNARRRIKTVNKEARRNTEIIYQN